MDRVSAQIGKQCPLHGELHESEFSKAAGTFYMLPEITPHMFHHACCTNMTNLGVEEK